MKKISHNFFFFTKVLMLSLCLCVDALIADEKGDTTEPHVSESSANQSVINYLQGKFEPAKHPAFKQVKKPYTDVSYFYLREEALAAYQRMYQAAKKSGIKLKIRSATRNFNSQKRIWNKKWKQRRQRYSNPTDRALNILTLSSMPGSSRHHWGTEVDLNSFDNHWFSHGKGLKLYNWMQKNAATYGFCQPYTKKSVDRHTGYEEEKWHWSYKPLSKLMTKDAQQLLKDSQINGFQGSQQALNVGIVKNYILGIDPSCRN